MKVPIDFVMVSRAQQVLTGFEITSVNSSAVIPVTWSSSEIVIDNPADISLINSTTLKINNPSMYQVSGTFTFQINVSGTSASYLVVTMQSSTDGGTTWQDLSASALSVENLAVNHPQSVVFPNVLENLAVDELIRFVVSKPNSNATNYTTGSGFSSRLSNDVTKSIRFTRLTQ